MNTNFAIRKQEYLIIYKTIDENSAKNDFLEDDNQYQLKFSCKMIFHIIWVFDNFEMSL